jgi:hypothetical protein
MSNSLFVAFVARQASNLVPGAPRALRNRRGTHRGAPQPLITYLGRTPKTVLHFWKNLCLHSLSCHKPWKSIEKTIFSLFYQYGHLLLAIDMQPPAPCALKPMLGPPENDHVCAYSIWGANPCVFAVFLVIHHGNQSERLCLHLHNLTIFSLVVGNLHAAACSMHTTTDTGTSRERSCLRIQHMGCKLVCFHCLSCRNPWKSIGLCFHNLAIMFVSCWQLTCNVGNF